MYLLYKCEHCGNVVEKSDSEFIKNNNFENLQLSVALVRGVHHDRTAFPVYIMHECSDDATGQIIGVAKLVGCGEKK